MSSTLRPVEKFEPLPPNDGRTRIQRLQDLVCGGSWGNNDNICLIYWKPETENPHGGRWVAWVDNPTPAVNPLPEAKIEIAPN